MVKNKNWQPVVGMRLRSRRTDDTATVHEIKSMDGVLCAVLAYGHDKHITGIGWEFSALRDQWTPIHE